MHSSGSIDTSSERALDFSEPRLLLRNILRFPLSRERLGKLGAFPEPLSLPIEDIDGDGTESGDDSEDGSRPFKVVSIVCAANVLVDYQVSLIVYEGQREGIDMEWNTSLLHQPGSLERDHSHQ